MTLFDMTLLDFARGPALQVAAIVFALGMLWRVVGIATLLGSTMLSKSRRPDAWRGGLRTMIGRFGLNPVFRARLGYQYAAGWVWHVGFVVVLFFFGLHVVFFEGLFGLSWPALPNGVILATAAVTLGILIGLFARRLIHPVLRSITRFDDLAALVVTMLPLVTGLNAFLHAVFAYETALALHFLSVALLLVWFPFSKLFHVLTLLPSRYVLGAKFWRKGVEI